jgi:cytoskeleton protein RodZ
MTEGRNPGGFVPVDAIFAGSGTSCVQLSAGEKLRDARARLGLTLDSAAARTRIRRDYLEALETMDPRGLPSRAYCVGYLRTYAQFLSLDETAIVDQFKREVDTQTGRAIPTAPKEKREIKLPRGAFGAVLILTGVAGIAWWYANTASGEGAFADVPPPPDAELSLLEDDALANGARNWSVGDVWRDLPAPGTTTEEVVLQASAPTWLEVRDGSGRLLFSRELAAGERYRALSEDGLTVTTADAGLVEVFVDGQSFGLLGEPGTALDEHPVHAEAFLVAEAEIETAG